MKFTVIPTAWEETIDQMTAAGHEYVPELGAGVEFVIFNGTPAQFPDSLPASVQVVHTHMAGMDGLAAAGVLGRDPVRWSNAQGLYKDTVSESTVTLLLDCLQQTKLAVQAASFSVAGRMQEERRWLFDQTVAIIGAGGIGEYLIGLLTAFGARTLAVTRSGRSVPGADGSYAIGDLQEVLDQATVVVNILPLTEDTRGFYNADLFAQMRPETVFINVGRGPSVDTRALYEALISGQIAAAGLDVTDPEPLPDDHPLWAVENCIITPHVANTLPIIRARTGAAAVEAAAAFAAGEEMPAEVDVAAGY
ncbi:MAG: D-isomer specific 2-hydroxyacid dehydrogenase family protein [Corynebacterium sp.]|nr:D-isomer specific 2-hydroxyacid dehydrogenase family protein [Corynebacterium sp.]